jgi:phosphopantothenoylcysteine decarboxylase/phosphopantothenate--cysteine ligase
VIKAAAVADFAPAMKADQKIKKSDGDELSITLKKNRDILESLAGVNPKPFVVAFAAETESVESNAREKLARKNADLIVANDVSDQSIGFDSEQNEVLVIARDGTMTRLAKAPKFVIANRILDLVIQKIDGSAQ